MLTSAPPRPAPISPTIKSVPSTLPNPPVQVSAAIAFHVTRRSYDAPTPLRLWHLTSLDAPTVAAVWTLAFAWAAGVRLPMWIPILLALAAWSVYIADRLLDAHMALRRGELEVLRERHLFHHRHRRVLIPVAALAACAAAAIVFTLMPTPARERNSLLGFAALAYFTRVHSAGLESPGEAASRSRRFFRKELLVGLLFTAACALPALSRLGGAGNSHNWRLPMLATTCAFALLAWLNCHAIDHWESSARSGRSIASLGCLLAFGTGALAALFAVQQPRIAALLAAAAASSLLLALLDRLRANPTPLALRALADLVLLTPIVLLAPGLLGPALPWR